MGINVFYNIVREYAEALIKQRPDCISYGNTSICAVLTNKHDVFAGVTGISLNNGAVQPVPAEYLAINAMCSAGQTKARQMITISLTDFSVLKPDNSGIEMMLETDSENSKCEVFISPNESVKASEIVGNVDNDSSDDIFDGFDSQNIETVSAEDNAFEKAEFVSDVQETATETEKKPLELGSPADFSSGFDIDVTNPFYEAPAEDKEVATISSSPRNKSQNTAVENNGIESKTPEISKDELLKHAKKKKKIAKTIFGTRRK